MGVDDSWKRSKSGGSARSETKTATWNSVDGTQGLSKASLIDAENAVKFLEPIYQDYLRGKRERSRGTHDPDLDYYYVALADLQRHPDISPQRREEVDKLRKEVLKLRHPELTQ